MLSLLKGITTSESDNSFLAQAEAAMGRKDAVVTVCEGTIQAGKQLRIQLPDKRSELMTCTTLCAAGSCGNR